MPRKQQSRGTCGFGGRELTKGGLSKHLNSCQQRQEAIESVTSKTKSRQNLIHLQVQDSWLSDFWLHLEMKDNATLKDLDRYLRAIWLWLVTTSPT